MTVVIVCADDWEGIYVDGEMLWQHHHIEEYGWVQLHNQYPAQPWTEVHLNSAGYDWLCEDGQLPYSFSDIPEQYYK